MKQPSHPLLLVLGATVGLTLLFYTSTGWADGIKEPGRVTSEPPLTVRLPATRVVSYLVPEASLQYFNGRPRLRIRAYLSAGAPPVRIKWFVDTRDDSYQIFLLDEPAEDAVAIAGYIESRGGDADVSAIKADLIRSKARADLQWSQNLASQRARRSARLQTTSRLNLASAWLTPDTASNNDASVDGRGDWACDGNVYSETITEDPVQINLTVTKVMIYIEADPGETEGNINSGNSGCWADDLTVAGTTWYESDCGQFPYSSGSTYEGYQGGQYFNTNFPPLFPELWGFTWVEGGAMAGWSPYEGGYTDFFFDKGGTYADLLHSEEYGYSTVLCW